ncbi:MAG TPA: urease accessory protein UreD [Burkholderiales bacterium]|nr:urease accessory protein UreD [Burkholderiales bacterium]
MDKSSPPKAWHARLALHYTTDGGRSVLRRREHEGPLAVQKSLYPEGSICHNFVLHPPAGIAGGDQLDVDARLDQGTHVVLSTPGAGKWYRSSGATAHQRLHFTVGPMAVLEWLPQETIFYSGAQAQLRTRIDLQADAIYLGWEITCLGRPASGERFDHGQMRQQTEIYKDGRLRWNEQTTLFGEDPLLHSPIGMKGYSASATMLAAGREATPAILGALRALSRPERILAVTAIGDLILLRQLSHSAQQTRNCFAEARKILRPWLCGAEDQPLRIWRT